jgi:hypothetical protein
MSTSTVWIFVFSVFVQRGQRRFALQSRASHSQPRQPLHRSWRAARRLFGALSANGTRLIRRLHVALVRSVALAMLVGV